MAQRAHQASPGFVLVWCSVHCQVVPRLAASSSRSPFKNAIPTFFCPLPLHYPAFLSCWNGTRQVAALPALHAARALSSCIQPDFAFLLPSQLTIRQPGVTVIVPSIPRRYRPSLPTWWLRSGRNCHLLIPTNLHRQQDSRPPFFCPCQSPTSSGPHR